MLHNAIGARHCLLVHAPVHLAGNAERFCDQRGGDAFAARVFGGEQVLEVAAVGGPCLGVEQVMGDAGDAAVDPGGEAVDALGFDQCGPGFVVALLRNLVPVEGLVAAGERLPFGPVGRRERRDRDAAAQRTLFT